MEEFAAWWSKLDRHGQAAALKKRAFDEILVRSRPVRRIYVPRPLQSQNMLRSLEALKAPPGLWFVGGARDRHH